MRVFCGNELQELLEFWELAKFVVAKSQIFDHVFDHVKFVILVHFRPFVATRVSR